MFRHVRDTMRKALSFSYFKVYFCGVGRKGIRAVDAVHSDAYSVLVLITGKKHARHRVLPPASGAI